MGLKSKRKGRAGEQELVNLLQDHLGIRFKRNLQQTRDGGHDLEGLDELSIEVKRAAKPALAPWWKQTVAQAAVSCRVPVLAYRLDRCPWRFKMALKDIFLTVEEPRSDLSMTADMPVEGFCAVVRERFLN